MTNEEFSNEFDVLVNNYPSMSIDGFTNDPADNVFTEYEKSVFLTQAQHNVVVSLYNGKLTGETFETTEQQRRYLNELVRTCNCDLYTDNDILTVDNRSKLFLLPLRDNNTGESDVLFISYEELRPKGYDECTNDRRIEVVPTTQDEVHRIRKDPYRGPNKRRALRLSINDNMAEVISVYNNYDYNIRYIKRPRPIILRDLDIFNDDDEQSSLEPLNIEHYTKATECELNEAIHRTILEQAVTIAMTAKQISQQQQMQRQASQTKQNNDNQQQQLEQ